MAGIKQQIRLNTSRVVYLVPLYIQHFLTTVAAEVQRHLKFTNRSNTVQGALKYITLQHLHASKTIRRYNGLSLPKKLAPMSHQSLPNFDQCCKASQVITSKGGRGRDETSKGLSLEKREGISNASKCSFIMQQNPNPGHQKKSPSLPSVHLLPSV